MNAYRVKEIMWLFICLIFLAIALTGCSTAPQKMTATMSGSQYCYTKKTVEVVDEEKVSSKTTVECNDDRIERVAIKKAGIAENCGVFRYWMKQGENTVWKKGVSCQMPNGSWQIIDTDYNG